MEKEEINMLIILGERNVIFLHNTSIYVTGLILFSIILCLPLLYDTLSKYSSIPKWKKNERPLC